MHFTVEFIAKIVGGKIKGDKSAKIANISKIESAKEGDLCFFANPKYEHYLYTTEASAILINEHFEPEHEIKSNLILVKDAYASFVTILEKYNEIVNTLDAPEVHSTAIIDTTTQIGKNNFIGAYSTLGSNSIIGDNNRISEQVSIGKNVKIGNNVIINSGVKIYNGCIIHNNVTIHSNTVIGADGFGYSIQQNKEYKKVPQLGNVIIYDDVEIGAGCTIDRATIGSTLIHKGVKLDNLIHIAHNVQIGENTVIAAQTGVSGSTKIGKNCIIGGQVGIVGHIEIADGTRINAQSGVSKNIKTANSAVTDSPAFNYNEALRSQVVYKQLPELRQIIRKLEQELEVLKTSNNTLDQGMKAT